jgi:DNA-binding CsgD family transcriptional regulator
VVFGLSPAQKQVAIYVAQGLPLNDISDRMKITANTARTHLNRIFEKTGVHNQPALVRVLLSAGAPI